MRFLIFTTDLPPIEEIPTSGTALRTWGISQGLKESGCEIQLSVPKSVLAKNRSVLKNDLFSRFSEWSFDAFNQAQLIAKYKPDAVICGHWPACTLNSKPGCPVIIDLAGPHLLERHYQGTSGHREAVINKLRAISVADYYITSGPSQRLYFLSYLMRAGISDPEKRIIDIPMALSPKLPERKPRSYDSSQTPNFIYSGIFLPWQNPCTAINTVVDCLEKENKGKLTLIGGKHPSYDLPPGAVSATFDKLKSNPKASVKELVPYHRFLEELSSADVALNVMDWNLERQLAVPVRTTTYLWAGVPLIIDAYSDVGKLVEKYQAGWTVSEDTTKDLEDIVSQILKDPGQILERSKNALQLTKSEFLWTSAATKILSSLNSKEETSLTALKKDIECDKMQIADFYVSSETSIEQKFTSRINGLQKIQFCLATHAKEVSDQLNVSLKEISSTENLAEQKIAVTKKDDNKWMTFNIPIQETSAGKDYVLSISSESESGPRPCIWAVNEASYPQESLKHNHRTVPNKSLSLKTFSSL